MNFYRRNWFYIGGILFVALFIFWQLFFLTLFGMV